MHCDPWPEVIKILRKRRGLTQKQVAKLVGSTQKTISQWERALTRPKQDKKQELYEALKATDEEVDATYLEVVTGRVHPDRRKSSIERAEQLLKELKKPPSKRPKAELTFHENLLMSLKAAHELDGHAAWHLKCALEAMLDTAEGEQR